MTDPMSACPRAPSLTKPSHSCDNTGSCIILARCYPLVRTVCSRNVASSIGDFEDETVGLLMQTRSPYVPRHHGPSRHSILPTNICIRPRSEQNTRRLRASKEPMRNQQTSRWREVLHVPDAEDAHGATSPCSCLCARNQQTSRWREVLHVPDAEDAHGATSPCSCLCAWRLITKKEVPNKCSSPKLSLFQKLKKRYRLNESSQTRCLCRAPTETQPSQTPAQAQKQAQAGPNRAPTTKRRQGPTGPQPNQPKARAPERGPRKAKPKEKGGDGTEVCGMQTRHSEVGGSPSKELFILQILHSSMAPVCDCVKVHSTPASP
jgi:hypothetical protein